MPTSGSTKKLRDEDRERDREHLLAVAERPLEERRRSGGAPTRRRSRRAPSRAPSHGTRAKRPSAGSRQIAESIGSSVKLTKSDTSTATATVMPNWKKNRPMMPRMNATGTNTATIANVVAITARPISSVPSRAARWWSLPMPRWRTMFSRTTIASSISRPMHSDSAISVRKFSVKPKTYTAMKVAITEIGSVRPVMIVLRHECRNRNTMKTVRSAPSTIVTFTPFSDLLDEVRRRRRRSAAFTSGGSDFLQLRDRLLRARAHLDHVGVLDLEDLHREAGLAVDARERVGLALAVDDVGDLVEVHRALGAPRDDDLAEARRAP